MEETKDFRSIFDLGRNRAFNTNEELKEKVIEYFETGHNTRKYYDKKESMFVDMPVLTITGLTLFLGFAGRASFYDYINRAEKDKATIEEKEISYTLKRARDFIEREYEELLQTGNSTGAIFALKNFGWKDIQTLEGQIDDNGEKKFIIEHRTSKYENLDENGNIPGEETQENSSDEE